MEWLLEFIRQISWQQVAWGLGLFVVTFVGSILFVGTLLVLLPATYFLNSYNRKFWKSQQQTIRWIGIGAKNVVGFALVVLGVLQLVLPGQGLLTILIGLMLMDFPGKRRLERMIIGRPRVLAAINRLRARFNKPRLLLDEDEPAQPTHTDAASSDSHQAPQSADEDGHPPGGQPESPAEQATDPAAKRSQSPGE